MTQALAWALIHFVWQGALIGLATVAALRLFRFAPPTRYAIGVLALAAMALVPLATFGLAAGSIASETAYVAAPAGSFTPPASAESSGSVTSEAFVLRSEPDSSPAGVERGASLTPLVLGVWLIGVSVLSVRLIGGWFVARRLTRRAVRPASPELESLAQRISGRLALDRVVRVLESSAVAVPMLVGWLRPVVLLPASALSGLTPTQIEALLAHELAHIRRHDYLVNLLQSVVETLLFYHPAVWWVSRQVCRDRENCCDDLAVGVCDRLEYVSALANLAAMTAVPRPALAATDGSLVSRVRRLLSPETDNQMPRTSGWVAASAIVLAVIGAAALAPTVDGAPGTPAQASAATRPVVAPPAPAQRPTEPPTSPAPAVAAVIAGVRGEVSDDVPVAVPAGISAAPTVVVPRVAPVGVTSQNPPPPPPPPSAPPAPVRAVLPAPPAPPAQTLPDVPPPPAMAAPKLPPAPPAPAQDPERVREMREAERELRDVQREVEMKRLELEMQQAKVQAEAQLKTAQAQMETLKQQLEKTRQMVGKGLATPEAQAALEKELAMAMQQLKMAESEIMLRQSDIELRRREAMARAEYAERLAQLAEREAQARSADQAATYERQAELLARERAAIAARQSRAADVSRAAAAAEIEKRLAEARASGRSDPDAERFLEQQLAEIRGALGGSTAPVARTEPAREGDVLTLTVAGEPTLPSRYTVLRDGTIRLPFVGNVTVAGMTADQIRDAVARQLTDRNLKTNPTVTVEIRRPAR